MIYTLFSISAEVLTLNDIDNGLLSQEILSNMTRRTLDKNSTMYEDTVLATPIGSEASKLITQMTDIAAKKGLMMSSFWSQVHQPLESTDLHHHGFVEYSWVYYVKVPEDAGNLIFVLDDKDHRCPQHVFTPKEGNVIIFPSYIRHRVSKNMSNDIRISVAGDFSLYK